MSAYLNWKVGDNVVCIDPTPVPGEPVFGEIYTISWIGIEEGVVSIDITEIPAPPNWKFHRGYRPECFRPVQVRKTSIEVFERLLSPSDHDKHLIEVFDFVSMQGDLQ